jgi:hypothetical protein
MIGRQPKTCAQSIDRRHHSPVVGLKSTLGRRRANLQSFTCPAEVGVGRRAWVGSRAVFQSFARAAEVGVFLRPRVGGRRPRVGGRANFHSFARAAEVGAGPRGRVRGRRGVRGGSPAGGCRRGGAPRGSGRSGPRGRGSGCGHRRSRCRAGRRRRTRRWRRRKPARGRRWLGWTSRWRIRPVTGASSSEQGQCHGDGHDDVAQSVHPLAVGRQFLVGCTSICGSASLTRRPRTLALHTPAGGGFRRASSTHARGDRPQDRRRTKSRIRAVLR